MEKKRKKMIKRSRSFYLSISGEKKLSLTHLNQGNQEQGSTNRGVRGTRPVRLALAPALRLGRDRAWRRAFAYCREIRRYVACMCRARVELPGGRGGNQCENMKERSTDKNTGEITVVCDMVTATARARGGRGARRRGTVVVTDKR